jgi:putative salt-induced outer membrane protein YdiY
MQHRPRINSGLPRALLLMAVLLASVAVRAENVILHLKNGDRVSGQFVAETTNAVTVLNRLFGPIQVPLNEISKRENIAETPPPVAKAPIVPALTNSPPTTQTSAVVKTPSPAPEPEKKEPRGPMKPANPEATPIATTPSFWKHDLRFGLNLRYSSRDSQEFSVIAKSTYGKAPFRHIIDLGFRYGKLDGGLAANSLTGSEKTEYQLSSKAYVFGLVGGGYDEVRKIEKQFDLGPGIGMELLKLTNFVWKSELGFNFQQQYRSDDTRNTTYSVRVAQIFAWRIWEKLTADAKFEFFQNLEQFGEYRLRMESTLRYPVSKTLSLNLDVIDLYDTEPARNIPHNDLQIRSSIGVTF